MKKYMVVYWKEEVQNAAFFDSRENACWFMAECVQTGYEVGFYINNGVCYRLDF